MSSKTTKIAKSNKASSKKQPSITADATIAPSVTLPTTNHLAARAVLVQLYIPTVPCYKRDKEATDEVCNLHGVQGGKNSARVQKTLMDGPEMRRVINAAQKLRNLHARLTAPWNVGQGIAPAAKIVEIKAKMEEGAREYADAVNDLASKVSGIIDADRNRLGTLFKESDYRSAEEIRTKAAVRITILPVGTDFRAGMVDDAIASETARALDAQANQAKADLLERLGTVVRHAATRIENADKVARFCDSNITNVVEVAEQVLGCVFDGDERLASLCSSLKATFGEMAQNIDGIKDEGSSVLRDEATAKAKDSLKQIEEMMEGFM